MNIRQAFTKNGYSYRLIDTIHYNSARYGIFAQILEGVTIALEIQKVREKPILSSKFGHSIGDMILVYPTSNEWGMYGWTVQPSTDYVQFIHQLNLTKKATHTK